MLLWILLVLRHVLLIDISFGVPWLLFMHVLSFAACVAFAFLRPENYAWRFAALFNASLMILTVIAVGILGAGR